MQTTITPKYVDAPRPGKKNWSVKDESGTSYSVPPKLSPMLQVGVPVSLTYDVTNWNGKNFNMVEAVSPPPASVPPPIPQQAPQAAPPVSKYDTGSPIYKTDQRPNGHGTDPATAERIYVCGIVNATVGRQGVTSAAELVQVTQWAREAWRQTFGAQNGSAPF